MKSRKGQSATALVQLGLYAAIAVAAIFILREINTLLDIIIGNLLYLTLIPVVTFGGGVILYRLVQQERLTGVQAFAGITLIILGTLAVPIAGIQIGNFFQSATATVTVDVGQSALGGNPPSFNQLSVDNVRETGPKLFSVEREACIYNCGDWEVNVDVQCGDTVRTRTVTGTGAQTISKDVGGLPFGEQCTATGEMTRPENHVGGDPYTVDFSTAGVGDQ